MNDSGRVKEFKNDEHSLQELLKDVMGNLLL
jgi:hypothetical protein